MVADERVGRDTYVDISCQVCPSALDTLYASLPTEDTLGTDFQRDTCDLGCERAQLVHHGVDRLLQRGHLTLDLDLHLLYQVAPRDGGHHSRDRWYLIHQVCAHSIHLEDQCS